MNRNTTRKLWFAMGLLLALTTSSVSIVAQSPAPAQTHKSTTVRKAHNKAASGRAVTQTKQKQAALTPAQAFAMLRAGNQRFANGKMLHRNLLKQVKETADGQYPFATIVSCLDSRTSSELIFDQGIGDIFNARIAGNIVNEDIIGSLEFATKVVGSKVIAIVGHSNCGAVKGAIDDVKLGHLTGLLDKIKPAVDEVGDGHGARSSKNHELVEKVSEVNVKRMMQVLKEKSPLLKEMIDKGEILLVGGMYDLHSGKVTFYQH